MAEIDDVDIGGGQKASERQIMKWFKLAWRSAEREPFSWDKLLLIVVLVLEVVNIVVSAVRV